MCFISDKTNLKIRVCFTILYGQNTQISDHLCSSICPKNAFYVEYLLNEKSTTVFGPIKIVNLLDLR